MTPQAPAGFRSGFVSIIGRPNAGKSTLLNALVGDKLAIVSEKPQTTRTAIEGVVNQAGAQIIFIDTPGIHAGSSLLNRRMMDTVRSSLSERDLLLYLGDSTARFGAEDVQALESIRGLSTPVYLLLTKVDKLGDKRMLLPRIEEYKAVREFADYLPISAISGEGLDRLRERIASALPEGPAYFPPDYLTDQPERFLGAELIRERILRETRQEVPHAVAVVVDQWLEKRGLLRITATIYVERDGQKAIVIGAKGATLKKIGTLARQEMESMFSRKIFLELFVKVRKNWRDSAEFLNTIDWRSLEGRELEPEQSSD
jgi:GTP-binding protein Era